MSTLVAPDRRRELMQQVLRRMQGWQSIWMGSKFDLPSVAKGRYVAAKEFHDWLADGGTKDKAQKYLDERTAYWTKEQETFESFLFSLQLAERIKQGLDTPESLKGFSAHVFPGFEATPQEKHTMQFLKTQYQASRVELWHLARLLVPSK